MNDLREWRGGLCAGQYCQKTLKLRGNSSREWVRALEQQARLPGA